VLADLEKRMKAAAAISLSRKPRGCATKSSACSARASGRGGPLKHLSAARARRGGAFPAPRPKTHRRRHGPHNFGGGEARRWEAGAALDHGQARNAPVKGRASDERKRWFQALNEVPMQ